MRFEHYIDAAGANLCEASLSAPPERARLLARTAIARMEDGNFGDHKALGDGLSERRVDAEGGIRIYYYKLGDN